MRSPSDAEILEHPTSGQAGRYQGSGDASTRMRAGANEIQVVVALMAVSRPKVAQLHHVVTQPMGSASDQVVPLAPRKRYNLVRGATHGLCHNVMQLGYFRPANRHQRYHNLYFVGASTHPGTGIPTALISARLT